MTTHDSEQTVIGGVHLEEGVLTAEQIDLVLRHIPFEVGFLDEHRRLIYSNHGPDGIAAIADSVVESHEVGSHAQHEAFAVDGDGSVLQTSSFAVRDIDGQYGGVLLVNQDITTVRGLTGEQRILDWGEPTTES